MDFHVKQTRALVERKSKVLQNKKRTAAREVELQRVALALKEKKEQGRAQRLEANRLRELKDQEAKEERRAKHATWMRSTEEWCVIWRDESEVKRVREEMTAVVLKEKADEVKNVKEEKARRWREREDQIERGQIAVNEKFRKEELKSVEMEAFKAEEETERKEVAKRAAERVAQIQEENKGFTIMARKMDEAPVKKGRKKSKSQRKRGEKLSLVRG
jgi:colicin import membrane protein